MINVSTYPYLELKLTHVKGNREGIVGQMNNKACCVVAIADVINVVLSRHIEPHGVSNHRGHDCSPNRLFRRRSNEISKLRVTGLCEGNSSVTREFPVQKDSNAEKISI